MAWDPRQLVVVTGAFGALAFMLTIFVKLQVIAMLGTAFVCAVQRLLFTWY